MGTIDFEVEWVVALHLRGWTYISSGRNQVGRRQPSGRDLGAVGRNIIRCASTTCYNPAGEELTG